MTPTTTPTAAEELRDLLKEAIELLDDSAQLPFKDTAHHERVKRLGEEIGFGAMMSCATLGWREANAEQGYPVGSEFTVGHTRVVVEKFVERAKAALRQLHAGAWSDDDGGRQITVAAMRIAEACSDKIIGGDHGWEQLVGTPQFDEFLQKIRHAVSAKRGEQNG